MKNVFKVGLLAAGLFVAAHTNAQVVKKTEHAVSKGAKAVGSGVKTGYKATKKGVKTGARKTSEVASKGASAVVDKKYDGRVAPNGETVYIDSHSAYYYVNKKGHRVYVKESQLVAKP